MKNLLKLTSVVAALGLVVFGCFQSEEPLESPTMGVLTSALDGSERLGDPDGITIAQGTNIVAEGIGLFPDQDGTINITVPGGATVQQALIYWEGQHVEARQPFGDGEIKVNGNTVAGTRIGGPTPFYEPYSSTTYRADITNLVNPGPNALNITEMDFDDKNSGAGVLVIYDDGSGLTEIGIKDGNDLAYWDFSPPLDTTVPQKITFAETKTAKKGTMVFFAGSIQLRPTRVTATWDGPSIAPVDVEYCDILVDLADGLEWGTACFEVDVPLGANEVTLQALSERCGSSTLPETNPASFAWVCAGLAVPPEGQIGDYVWVDGECGVGDECQGAGDVPKANVTVNLYKCSDPSTIFMTTTTDAMGKYLFSGLEAGQYFVEFALPMGYEFVTPNACGITPNNTDSDADQTTGRTDCIDLEWGESDLSWDAGLCEPPDGEIGDYVWVDGECGVGDECQGAGDVPKANVTVNLYKCSDPSTIFMTMTTNAMGKYLFSGLEAGQYFVEFVLPMGYEFVTPNACGITPNNTDSDADQTTGRTDCIDLEWGESDLSWDAGLCEPPSGDGCTPGYWKQPHHACKWPATGYSPNANFNSTFGVSFHGGTVTLLQALEMGGGGYVALGRHAVAALLNASHPDVNYGMSAADVIAAVQAADASGDPGPAHSQLEYYNEMGCPLNNCEGLKGRGKP